jgi:putative flippase GtrA
MKDALMQFAMKHVQVFRFLVAGGIGFGINIVSLYVFTDVFHVYYIISTVLAFLIAFSVSFTLQKSWTFKDASRENMHVQLSMYLAMQLTNLGLNTGLMYVFVEYLHIWYIFSQVIITTILSIVVYTVNKKYIFNQQESV